MISFADFLGRIAHAVVDANEVAAESALARFLGRTIDVNGSKVPKTQKVTIGAKQADVPELGLIHPSQIPIKRARIYLTTMVDFGSVETIRESGRPVKQLMLSMKRARRMERNTELTIEIDFEAAEPTETQEVLRDALVAKLRDEVTH